MVYTPEQQESDRSFLVGANYGRGTERKRILDAIREIEKEETCELVQTIKAAIGA